MGLYCSYSECRRLVVQALRTRIGKYNSLKNIFKNINVTLALIYGMNNNVIDQLGM